LDNLKSIISQPVIELVIVYSLIILH